MALKAHNFWQYARAVSQNPKAYMACQCPKQLPEQPVKLRENFVRGRGEEHPKQRILDL